MGNSAIRSLVAVFVLASILCQGCGSDGEPTLHPAVAEVSSGELVLLENHLVPNTNTVFLAYSEC